MFKTIKKKLIQAVVKSDAFKNEVEDLAIERFENYLNDCDYIDRNDLNQTLRDVVWDNDLITSDNIDNYIEDFVAVYNINDHIDERLKEKNLDDFDIEFEVTKYCEENLSKNFLEHANALAGTFKVVVVDTFGKEANNG